MYFEVSSQASNQQHINKTAGRHQSLAVIIVITVLSSFSIILQLQASLTRIEIQETTLFNSYT